MYEILTVLLFFQIFVLLKLSFIKPTPLAFPLAKVKKIYYSSVIELDLWYEFSQVGVEPDRF